MFVEAPIGMAIFPDASFDVVHIRQMLFSVSKLQDEASTCLTHQVAEFGDIIGEAYRLLRQGGVLLIHECSMVMESGWPGKSIEDLAPATARVRRLPVFVFDIL